MRLKVAFTVLLVVAVLAVAFLAMMPQTANVVTLSVALEPITIFSAPRLGVAPQTSYVTTITDVTLVVTVSAARTQVPTLTYVRGVDTFEANGTKLFGGVGVSMAVNMTITNATGAVVFQRTVSWAKGADRTLSIYTPADSASIGGQLTISVSISLTITGLPTGTVTRTVTRVITVTVVQG